MVQQAPHPASPRHGKAVLLVGSFIAFVMLLARSVELWPAADTPQLLDSSTEKPDARSVNSDGMPQSSERIDADWSIRIMVTNAFGEDLASARIISRPQQAPPFPVRHSELDLAIVGCAGYESFALRELSLDGGVTDYTVVLAQQPGLYFALENSGDSADLFVVRMEGESNRNISGEVLASAMPISAGVNRFLAIPASGRFRVAARGSAGFWQATMQPVLWGVPDLERTVAVRLSVMASVWGHVDMTSTPSLDAKQLRVALCPASGPPISVGLPEIACETDMELLASYHAVAVDESGNYNAAGLQPGVYWIYVVANTCRVSWPVQVALPDGNRVVAPTIATDLGNTIVFQFLGLPPELVENLSVVVAGPRDSALLGFGMRFNVVPGETRIVGLRPLDYTASYSVHFGASPPLGIGSSRLWPATAELLERMLSLYAPRLVSLTGVLEARVDIDLTVIDRDYLSIYREGGGDLFRSWWRQALDARNSSREFFLQNGLSNEYARVAYLERDWQKLRSCIAKASTLTALQRDELAARIDERSILGVLAVIAPDY